MSVTYYYVKPGDTLRSIASAVYRDSNVWHDIAKLNGIRDPRRVRVGQSLKLP